MTYKTTFNNGLKLELPNKKSVWLCSCEWHDDPFYIIQGTTLKKFQQYRDIDPVSIRELPVGTIVRLWDDEAGDPILGVL